MGTNLHFLSQLESDVPSDSGFLVSAYYSHPEVSFLLLCKHRHLNKFEEKQLSRVQLVLYNTKIFNQH